MIHRKDSSGTVICFFRWCVLWRIISVQFKFITNYEDYFCFLQKSVRQLSPKKTFLTLCIFSQDGSVWQHMSSQVEGQPPQEVKYVKYFKLIAKMNILVCSTNFYSKHDSPNSSERSLSEYLKSNTDIQKEEFVSQQRITLG